MVAERRAHPRSDRERHERVERRHINVCVREIEADSLKRMNVFGLVVHLSKGMS